MAELSPLRFYLAVIKPVTVFTGRVNGTPADPFNSITWDGGATGTSSAIGTSGAPVEGNTVFFGSTAGGRERGLVRLRSWTPSNGSGTAGTMITAENDDVSPNIEDDDFITIKLFWQLWDKVPRQDASNPSNIIFFEDFDVAYNQQTVEWVPWADAGPPGAEFLEAGQAQISFIGDRSFALAPGATLSSFLWTAHGSNEGTSSSQGTEASPVVFTYPGAGQFLVTLKVTDSNGIDHTNYTWAIVIDPADPTAVAYTQFDAISDNFDANQGGGSCGFTVHGVADVSQFPTETLVLHVARGTQTTPTATWPNRSNILYSGYITGNGIRQDPINNTTSFRTVTIDGLMKKLSIYPVRLSDSSNPQNWTQAKDLTVDRVLSYLAHWRSTLSLMTNVRPLNDTAELKSQDFNKANLFGMFKSLMGDAWGLPISDHQSVLHLVRDFNLQTTTERATATTRKTLHKGIWVAAIDIAERGEYEQPVRKVKWNGVFYAGDGVAAIPLFSEAPGDVMDSWGNEQARSGLILTTQADLNIRTGFAYSRANQRYPGVSMRFLNDGSFTIAPQEIFPANIEAGDNNRGLVFTPDLIPRTIRRSYDHVGGSIDYQVTFEPSVTGPGGITVVAASAPMPAKPASSTGGGVAPPGDPPPAPPAWTQPTVPIAGPAVGADVADGCYITFDSGASWERRNNLLINPDQLAMQYLIWDPWWFTSEKQGTNDPEQLILWACGLGFVAKSEDAGKSWQDLTQNIDDPPNTVGDSPAPTVADVTFGTIHGDIHSKNRFVIIVNWTSGGAEERGWIIETSDDGVTWSWTELAVAAAAGTNPNTLTWLLDADPDQEAYSDDDAVPTITNQGTGANGTGGVDPTFKTNIINGKSVYRFDSASSEYKNFGTGFGKPANFTLFMVIKTDTTTRMAPMGSDEPAGADKDAWASHQINHPSFSTGELVYIFGDGTNGSVGATTNAVISAGTFVILGTRYTSGDTAEEIWVNGGQVSITPTQTSANSVGGTAFDFSMGRSGEVDAFYFDGDIGRTLLVNSALTDAQMENLGAWLVNYYFPSTEILVMAQDIDLENGATLYITVWDGTSLILQNRQSGSFSTVNKFNTFGVASLAQITARTFWIACFTPPFFGTASLDDIIYVHGRWDDGTVRHLSKSTDGGSSFADIGDSATWLTGWVGAFFADDANTLFAFVNGASRALYRSINAGSSWTNLSTLPFDVDPGGVSKHPDGRILISNRDAGSTTAAYAEAPDYSSWIDATGSPSFPISTPGAGSNAIIWIT